MRKLYSSITLGFILCSCGTRINYLGTSYPSTNNVDIYISSSSAKKPYDVIGKGYVSGYPNIDKIQRKSIEKAKLVGADAVLFEDYFVVDNTSSVTTSLDSTTNGTKITTSANPTMSPNFTIKFLRYK
jgi:hypothetical protein